MVYVASSWWFQLSWSVGWFVGWIGYDMVNRGFFGMVKDVGWLVGSLVVVYSVA